MPALLSHCIRVASSALRLHWKIAPGYYLYRDRIGVTATPSDRLGAIDKPAGERKEAELRRDGGLPRRGQAGARFDQFALPTTLFFDATGRLVDQRVGELSHATLAQRVDALGPSSPTSSSSLP